MRTQIRERQLVSHTASSKQGDCHVTNATQRFLTMNELIDGLCWCLNERWVKQVYYRQFSNVWESRKWIDLVRMIVCREITHHNCLEFSCCWMANIQPWLAVRRLEAGGLKAINRRLAQHKVCDGIMRWPSGYLHITSNYITSFARWDRLKRNQTSEALHEQTRRPWCRLNIIWNSASNI